MGFLNYVLMGAIAYGSGWLVRYYVLNTNIPSERIANKQGKETHVYSLKHPLVIKYLVGFFIIMLFISALIGRYILAQQGLDIAFILVNSVVATFVFSFGLIKDQVKHDLPD